MVSKVCVNCMPYTCFMHCVIRLLYVLVCTAWFFWISFDTSCADQNCDDELRLIPQSKLDLIRQKRRSLIQNISCVRAVLDGLLSIESFSADHCEAISSYNAKGEQIRKMLDILECRSFSQYNGFIATLRTSHHTHAADILESNAGILILLYYGTHPVTHERAHTYARHTYDTLAHAHRHIDR